MIGEAGFRVAQEDAHKLVHGYAWTANRRFHVGLAVANLAYQLPWILRSVDVLA
ncbi:hypothetical protein [Variovorax sp. JS1663]|uniref:hypothetical protein n=1 Tax=Variovorax sp. JS1663 TaxID=1851577 RepID=UPI001302353A|nr:hypothetical protein [Variovorax sp. JS1663]